MKQQINSRAAYSSWNPKNLKEYRLKINKTPTQMGETLGVSSRMYRYYESGRTPISRAMEYAMKYLVESEFSKEEFAKLTPFERDRMERLRDGIAKELDKGEKDPQFSQIFRMCRQAIKEFDNILSK
tara:strand:- start:2358 stop:2738 length:381 start_codon:yes stop_codon:yes gene_type:complete